jgi:lysophospholipase L1-like esterase
MTKGAKAGQTNFPPIRIVLVGDSTVADYGDNPRQAGWGQMLGQLLSENVTIINLARNGRSSKSFIAEGLWEKALAAKGDFILIQFGHNDCPGKGERTTDPDTTYSANLRRYVADARVAGATAVLITSMERRKFTPDGRIACSLSAYAEAMRKVAAAEKVGLVDLHAKSIALYERLGPERAAAELSSGDQTHFSHPGAMAMARLVVEDLAKAEPRLAPYIKTFPAE